MSEVTKDDIHRLELLIVKAGADTLKAFEEHTEKMEILVDKKITAEMAGCRANEIFTKDNNRSGFYETVRDFKKHIAEAKDSKRKAWALWLVAIGALLTPVVKWVYEIFRKNTGG